MERMALEDPDSVPFYNAKKNSDRRNAKLLKKVPLTRPGIAPNKAN
jgi:hypothetical protein